MTERESLMDARYLLSVTASIPGTSLDDVSISVNGIQLQRRFYWKTRIDFSWGTA